MMTPGKAALLVSLSAMLGCTGCEVLTTAQLPPTRDDRILGTWRDIDNGQDQVIIRFIEGEYRAGSQDDFDNGKVERFTLSRVGAIILVQSLVEPESGVRQVFRVPQGQPCWSLSRVELVGDQMNLYNFDRDRLARDSWDGKLRIDHEVHRSVNSRETDHDVLFRAPAADLQQFLEAYLRDSMVFKLSSGLKRVPDVQQK